MNLPPLLDNSHLETHPVLAIRGVGLNIDKVRAALAAEPNGVIRLPDDAEIIRQRPYNRESLMAALIANRTKQQSGSGEKYWNSVCDTVERELNIYPIYDQR